MTQFVCQYLMRLIRLLVVTVVLWLALAGQSNAELSSELTIANKYVWRGALQSENKTALSASLDYVNENGFYLGMWGGNVDFDSADIELDTYAGMTFETGDYAWDVGYIYYAFPGADKSDQLNSGEFYTSVSYANVTVGMYTLANSDAQEDGSLFDSVYLYTDVEFSLSPEVDAKLHIGQYSGDYISDDPLTDLAVEVFWHNFSVAAYKVLAKDKQFEETNWVISYSTQIDW